MKVFTILVSFTSTSNIEDKQWETFVKTSELKSSIFSSPGWFLSTSWLWPKYAPENVRYVLRYDNQVPVNLEARWKRRNDTSGTNVTSRKAEPQKSEYLLQSCNRFLLCCVGRGQLHVPSHGFIHCFNDKAFWGLNYSSLNTLKTSKIKASPWSVDCVVTGTV